MGESTGGMDAREFAALLKRCGSALGRLELEELESKGWVVPWSIGYTGAHLLVATHYERAVSVPRHEWADDPKVDLSGVERLARLVADSESGGSGVREALARELERELARIDPFGPLARIVDILRADVVEQLGGAGRVYAELRSFAESLASGLESELAESSEEASSVPVYTTGPVVAEDEDDDEVLEALSEVAGGADDLVVEGGDDEIVIEEDELSVRVTAPIDELAGELEELAEPEAPVEEPSAPSEPSEPEVAEPADEAVSVPPPLPTGSGQANPFTRTKTGVRSTRKTDSLKSRLEALRTPTREIVVEPDFPELADEGEGLAESTQEATSAHMEQRLSLERRIEQLNAKRQEFLAAQNWAGLVELYMNGLELFEGVERAQVLVTVAKLSAAKLKDVEGALDAVGRVWAMRSDAGGEAKNAVDLVVQLAQANAKALEWLEGAREDAGAQSYGAWVRALAGRGERERALMTWGAYLAADVTRVLDEGALGLLEELSVGASGEEVDGLYDDLLEQLDSGVLLGKVSLSAARAAAARVDLGAASRHVERALDGAHVSQDEAKEAFAIYVGVCERVGVWGALEELANRWTGAKPESAGFLDARRAEIAELASGEVSAGAVEFWEARLSADATDRMASARLDVLYDREGRWAERYALLNRGIGHLSSDDERVSAYLSMAKIAVEFLEAPDEAAIHYARIIEIVPDHPEAHEGLQSLGA